MLTEDGQIYWVLSRGKVISRDEKGQPLRMIGTHINITEREVANLLYMNSAEGMLVTDANNHIITVNPAFIEITEFSLQDVADKKLTLFKTKCNSDKFYEEMQTTIEQQGQWQGEIWIPRKNNEAFPAWLTINTIYNPDQSVHYRIALFSDITEKKAAEDVIWQKANFDTLTGLPNRQMFYDRLAQELKRAYRNKNKLALLFIDLDQFKEVNDSLGHLVGDQLLIKVAKRLQQCVRETDTVARLSGDEFIIIANNVINPSNITDIAEHILNKLQKPFVIGVDKVYISASIGITLYPDDNTNSNYLFRNVDQAMYQAKRNGRNCYAFYTQALQEAALQRTSIANDLRSAVVNHEFVLFYQPLVELPNGRIHKAEALIRWQHPQGGLVLPDQFISIAESSGLIHDIGNWVFFEAARQVKEWQQQLSADFQISINKSPIQFQRDDAPCYHWINYLQEANLSNKSIVIEITESLFLDISGVALAQLNEFQNAGIEISLDDFGTGFSSLSYLQKMDIDYLKIDRSFVRNLTEDSTDFTLCKAIIHMAHALGIKVIAEGIETLEQRDLLLKLECDYGQGYLFSKPVPALDFGK